MHRCGDYVDMDEEVSMVEIACSRGYRSGDGVT